MARLAEFTPRAGIPYATGRNVDHGPGGPNSVSALSPWLRHRLILEQEVIGAVLSRHSLAAAEKFIQEVYWRAYFKGWLEQRPQIWQRYRADVESLVAELENNTGLRTGYEKAVSGATGIECFDHWARELVDTGYLHNHARMWFASIWIFTLTLPWQLGADFFYRHLVDGDAASNTLSWRWVGGLHTKGKTYLAQADNIARFTNGRFNPAGQLVDNAPALQEQEDEAIGPLPARTEIDPSAPYLLLLHEDDCHAASLALPGRPAAIAGLAASQMRSPLPVSEAVSDFTGAALADGCRAATSHFGAGNNAVVLQASEAGWADRLVALAHSAKARRIVTPYAPVGPVAEALQHEGPAFDKAGLTFCRILRPYDAEAWPHATKGFFKLKKKIPGLIERF
ncbi:FAD-binding domain-containing protein [Aquisalinus flavus]|uniref:Cryptochrome/DNA photolyase FAD-binding domain-containing protein n=1 Tax=Aquisalinus flavus TaxID=1526572 RepID=A0A8J2Y689_9PROT|nr:FAD-binding domain-containing protein [Aquisalinus flavus]GGD06985.1 hypothetical protein GCM10011342_14730 [Aquisalinus flavus]